MKEKEMAGNGVSESIIYAKVKQLFGDLRVNVSLSPVEVIQQCWIFLFQFIFIIPYFAADVF